MISVEAMTNELEKISAFKARKKAVPIKAAKLASKETYDKTKYKTAGKVDAAKEIGKKVLGKHGKKGALVAGSIGTWEVGKQGVKDWEMGRQYRKQMESRG